MALGRTVFEISTGGGSTGPGAQAASRQLVLAGVSPAGTAATLYKPQSASAIRASFDVGPLAEALLYCQVAGAPPPMALPINPSVVGCVSAVTQVGTGLATIAVTIAPHRAITVLCTLGGAIATAKFKFSLEAASPTAPSRPAPTAAAAPGSCACPARSVPSRSPRPST